MKLASVANGGFVEHTLKLKNYVRYHSFAYIVDDEKNITWHIQLRSHINKCSKQFTLISIRNSRWKSKAHSNHARYAGKCIQYMSNTVVLFIMHSVENRCARSVSVLFNFSLRTTQWYTLTFSYFRINHTVHDVIRIYLKQLSRFTSICNGILLVETARIASYFHFCCEMRNTVCAKWAIYKCLCNIPIGRLSPWAECRYECEIVIFMECVTRRRCQRQMSQITMWERAVTVKMRSTVNTCVEILTSNLVSNWMFWFTSVGRKGKQI